jgi:hypothetical protein
MAEDNALSDAIQQAVQREVARVLQEGAAVQVQAAERGISLSAPLQSGARYTIYWTKAA